MAFPTIQTADTKNGVVTSNSNSWTLTYPTNIASGDLLLAFVAIDGDTTPTFPADWTRLTGPNIAGGAITFVLGMKDAVGTETGNFTLSLSASEQGAWRIFRITGWYGGSIIASAAWGIGQADSDSLCAWVNVSSAAPSTTPDPVLIDPANWATEDTLWFAACGVDTSRTISVYPLADNNTADVSGGAGGATLGLCSVNSAVATQNPGTFTISSSDDWVAATVGVRPAAAAAYVPRNPAINHQNPALV